MQHGFVKAICAVPNLRIADCTHNAKQISGLMQKAEAHGAHLLLFPELCITGYTCGDLFHQEALLHSALRSLLTLVEESRHTNALTAVGFPFAVGNSLYNCAGVFCGGKLLGIVPKQHLPNYGEFYEFRHFMSAPKSNGSVQVGEFTVPFGNKLLFPCETLHDLVVGVELCEDLWVPVSPSCHHCTAGATVIMNLSASSETVGKPAYRRKLIEIQSARLICGYMYSDAGFGESSTDLAFSGHCLIAENGTLQAEAAPFSGEMAISELDVAKLRFERRHVTTYPALHDEGYEKIKFSLPFSETHITRKIPLRPFVPEKGSLLEDRCSDILSIQAEGLAQRLSAIGAKTVVVGLSGGLDSTLALLVCLRAMKRLKRSPGDIIAVTMPCFGTTKRTRSNAEALATKTGVSLRVVDITQSVLQHFQDIQHDALLQNTVFENAQARERTQVLMDIANQTSGIVIGTGDLSELALGWATYNGDHMSMYGVNAGVPKTLVRHLVDYEAGLAFPSLRSVLLDILDTPVSPELLTAENGEVSQKTEELIGPYELHDFFLYYMIRFGFSASKIYRLAKIAFEGRYEDQALLKWLRIYFTRFFAQQFKRSCLPDGPKIGSVTLSPRGDWRMPSDASAAVWLDEIAQLEQAEQAQ
jgi:NAD+ synthase (glutamine-hydrolysing)